MEIAVGVGDWSQWAAEAYESWQWAALSVSLPPSPDMVEFLEEVSCGHFSDTEQGAEYNRRKKLLTAALVRGALPGLQQAQPLTSKDQIVWAAPGQPIPAGSFVAWALREGWTLPEPLKARREPVARKLLEDKYVGIAPNISDEFGNQAKPKKRNARPASLKEAASLHSVKRGTWDEYSVILWLRDNGRL